jgi:hypothetical protein
VRAAHLIATAGALLALFVACYPSAECVTGCGETFTGQDCAGFDRLESATVAAFATCDAGSPDDTCAQLAGWRVDVLPEEQTFPIDDAGSRAWPAPPNNEGVKFAYADTDCIHRTVMLADEVWSNGAAATELVNASQRRCYSEPGLYSQAQWVDTGFSCVVATAERAPLVLTGSQGEGP